MNNNKKRYISEAEVDSKIPKKISELEIDRELGVKNWNKLEDRPFYKIENPNKILINGNFTAETILFNGNNFTAVALSTDLSLTSEIVYKIIINENEYTTQKLPDSNNPGKLMLMDNPMNPTFAVAWSTEFNTYCVFFANLPSISVGNTVTVRIEDEQEYFIKLLDEMYLPENLGHSGDASNSWNFGTGNISSGANSLTIGDNNINNNSISSLVAGSNNKVSDGGYILVSGVENEVAGDMSSANGNGIKVQSKNQHVEGKFNILDESGSAHQEGEYVHIVGNGTSNIDRSNAHTLDWDGNAEYAGDVIAHACGGESPISLVELASKINNVAPQSVIQLITWEADD